MIWASCRVQCLTFWQPSLEDDGTEQEVYTVEELIKKFDLNRVQKSGGIFDEQRLIYLNGVHIGNLSLDELYEKIAGFWPPETANADDAYKKDVLRLVHERLKFFSSYEI